MRDLIKRYIVATLGLAIVALGVALSLKSNLGTSPVSCPPAFLNLGFRHISVGTFTWMMHIVLILAQIVILRRNFKLSFLMQIPAAFVFGYLCDFCIWLVDGIQVSTYLGQMFLCLLTIVVTAIGIRLEVLGDVWMLAGEKTVVVLSEATKIRFSSMKIAVDLYMLVVAAIFGLIAFGSPFGDGHNVIIREGTLILAILTGACMHLTDPLVDKAVRKIL